MLADQGAKKARRETPVKKSDADSAPTTELAA
jgi:hypothetical protein